MIPNFREREHRKEVVCMITSLYSNKYLRVDNVWKESTLFLRNTVPEIARFILSHAKEYLAFYSLDNYLLFEWNKSEIIAPESVFIYFDEMDDFLNQIRSSLTKEKPILPKVYSAIAPFQNSYICLCPQINAGTDTYNFLSWTVDTSSSFQNLMEQLSIDTMAFINEVQFLFLAHFIGNYFPTVNQYLEYNAHKIRATLQHTSTGMNCYFDTV